MKKVHTRVVIDMMSGATLEDEFYWYEGEWAKCEEQVEDVGGFFEKDLPRVVEDPTDPKNIGTVLGLLGLGGAAALPLLGFPAAGAALGAAGLGSAAISEGATNYLFPQEIDAPAPEASDFDDQSISEFNAAREEFQLLQQGLRKESTPGGFRIAEIPEAELAEAVGERGAEKLILGRQIQRERLEFELAAGRGEVTSEAFNQAARESRQQAETAVARGAGAQSTSGAQQLALNRRTNELLREQISQGRLSGAGAINLQQQQLGGQLQNQLFQGLQQGRLGAGQLGLQQQGQATQLQLAQLLGQFGQQAGQQQLLGTIGGAAIPGLIGLL
jgi:hypothetical protein